MNARTRVLGPVIAMLCVMAAPFTPGVPAEAAQDVVFVVSAHPDDESAMFAKLEDHHSTAFKILIFATNGDASGACNPANEVYYDGVKDWTGTMSPDDVNAGEVNPQSGVNHPSAGGKYSAYCKDARQYSTINYLNYISANVWSSMPGPLYPQGYTGNLSSAVGSVPSNTSISSTHTDRRAEWWSASDGVVIFFDGGDGNLTRDEVRWMVTAVQNHKSTFGIPSGTEQAALGNYRSKYTFMSGTVERCDAYNHVDHTAVHQGLWDFDLGIDGSQYAATCALDGVDSAASSHLSFHPTLFNTAYPRQGYSKYYGWLLLDNYPADRYNSGPASTGQLINWCGRASGTTHACADRNGRVQNYWKRY